MNTAADRPRVLVVDDEPSMCEMLHARLSRRDFAPTCVTSLAEATSQLTRNDFQAILVDLNLKGASGLDLCKHVAETRPNIPVVVFTAFGSMETAIAAIRAGAYDFVTKPIDVEALVVVLRRAVQHHGLREEVKRLRQRVTDVRRLDELQGRSPAVIELIDLIERIQDSDVAVLVTGESGTGKELVARALHSRGSRREGPFVSINCGAVPETVLESELFGTVGGGASAEGEARDGLFVQAEGGTIFLDEIADLPLALQPKLLRVLQERKVRPMGGTEDIPVNVRVIAATNQDLEAAIEQGRFREALYFRLNIIQVDVPPLRARGMDTLLLAQDFLEICARRSDKSVTGISQPAAEKLLEYAWPGNVRELQNCIERAVALARFSEITVDDLPEKIRHAKRSDVVVSFDDPSTLQPMDEIEKRYILRVLEAVGGNKRQAARILGFDRKTLYRKLDRIGGGTRAEAGPA